MIALVLAALIAQASSPQPSSSPAPELPEIGRVRAVSPACAVIHDLVIPSFAAAQRADVRFVATSKRLPRYIDVMDDPIGSTSTARQAMIMRLDSDASELQQEALVLQKALGDQRLTNTTDPQVVAEREALEKLYRSQQVRAALLAELALHEHVVTARHGMEDSGAFTGPMSPANVNVSALPGTPLPPTNVLPGMPLLSGNALGDKEMIRDWTASIARFVRGGENEAAKTFLPIAQGCR